MAKSTLQDSAQQKTQKDALLARARRQLQRQSVGGCAACDGEAALRRIRRELSRAVSMAQRGRKHRRNKVKVVLLVDGRRIRRY